MTDDPDARFTMIPRSDARPHLETDRWPMVRRALSELLDDCEQIAAIGHDEFLRPGSLTYRAAEAVVIHFDDIIRRRIPDARRETIPAQLSLATMGGIRNIIAHNYTAADKAIVWDVIDRDIPIAIRQIVAANS